ncbi:MAG: toast rack family protein [Actinobacteria bacterium]|nr:toast rack family protein [Actinomycetota bacterium]
MNLGKISAGLFLIFLGVVFLLINAGYIGWDFWLGFGDWWPLILVFLGIGLLFGKRVPVTLTLLILGFILLGWAAFNGAMGFVPAEGNVQVFQELSPAVKEARVKLDLGAADFSISSGTGGLFEGELGYYRRKPMVDYEVKGSRAEVEVKQDSDGLSWLGRKGRYRALREWNVKLTDRVPLDLRVNAGAIRGRMDLSGLDVRRAEINAGASDLRIAFGTKAANARVELNTGASKVVLVIPENVGVRVRSGAVLSDNDLGVLGLVRRGNELVSPNYDTAPSKIDLEVSSAVSSLRAERP